MSRPSVVVLCGGRSAERFVSTVSAQCVVANLDPRRFRTRLVHIAVDGSWAEISPRRLLAETTEALHAGANRDDLPALIKALPVRLIAPAPGCAP